MNVLIEELKQDKVSFVKKNDIKTIIKLIKFFSKNYYIGNELIDDKLYDFLIDYIKKIDPNNKILLKIGYKMTKDKKLLPYFMGSLNKIKNTEEKFLNNWIRTNKDNSYICSDKLDGISCLVHNHKNKISIFTRGDGYYGLDITELGLLIPSLKKLIFREDISIRGELIMEKNKFIKYANKYSNARNLVAGIINNKNPEKSILEDINFVAYELLNPWINNQIEQFKKLKMLNVDLVNYEIVDKINVINLELLLEQRKNKSKYDVDGIVVSVVNLPERNINSNPSYMFAFKSLNLMESKNATVISIKWNISKDGYLKPTIILEPIILNNVKISNVTGFNARYIEDNKLGKGSIVKIIRSGDVIPHIINIVKISDSGEADMPNVKFYWNESNIDIYIKGESLQKTIKLLTFFVKQLNIRDISESTIEKFINKGINSIKKIIEIRKTDLENIDGFKEKMIDKIYSNIKERIDKLTLLDLAVSSNIFGRGISNLKLKKIFIINENFLELEKMEKDELYSNLINIEGFNNKTILQFIEKLKNFSKLFYSLNQNIQNLILSNSKKINSNLIFTSMIFVFSGFRDKDLEEYIIKNGGTVTDSISKKTNLLITTEENIKENKNLKILKAKEYNIEIITKENFIAKFSK